MAADNFFARWAKQNTELNIEQTDKLIEPGSYDQKLDSQIAPSSAPAPVLECDAERPIPTQGDVDQLTHESDFSVFMGKGVDEQVKRGAMKKLFSDPQFNVMDGLDIYIDDYTKFEPMTPAVLASLNHVKDLLDPLSRLEKTISGLLDTPETSPSIAQPVLVPDDELAVDQQVLVDVEDQEQAVEQTQSEEHPDMREDKHHE